LAIGVRGQQSPSSASPPRLRGWTSPWRSAWTVAVVVLLFYGIVLAILVPRSHGGLAFATIGCMFARRHVPSGSQRTRRSPSSRSRCSRCGRRRRGSSSASQWLGACSSPMSEPGQVRPLAVRVTDPVHAHERCQAVHVRQVRPTPSSLGATTPPGLKARLERASTP
jgi:hypothetical protein